MWLQQFILYGNLTESKDTQILVKHYSERVFFLMCVYEWHTCVHKCVCVCMCVGTCVHAGTCVFVEALGLLQIFSWIAIPPHSF